MNICYDFDSGSIAVISTTDIDNIQVALRPDNNCTTRQWFHFRCQTKAGLPHTIRIVNAGDSSFANAWQRYQVMASYDRENWFRLPTTYNSGELVIRHTPIEDSISYAYFTPYDYARQQMLVQASPQSDICQLTSLITTADGHSLDMLTIGKAAPHKQAIWLIARQHPGETMAQWFAEGLIHQLLTPSDEVSSLLEKAVFYIVPNMNPDGGVRGNHRTNSHGLNLNRQWDKPSKTRCPEVYSVQQMMQQTGVDLLLDIHGEEEIPYCFIMPANGGELLAAQAERFKRDFVSHNPDMQTEIDYDSYKKKYKRCCGVSCKDKQSMATQYVTGNFDCLAMVLEMPFIDNQNRPNASTGWSASRSVQLGADVIKPIATFIG